MCFYREDMFSVRVWVLKLGRATTSQNFTETSPEVFGSYEQWAKALGNF